MSGLDADRPLWTFTVVEGLDGGRAAVVVKLHHVLTDGVGGIAMLPFLVDATREPGDLGPMPSLPEDGVTNRRALTLDALGTRRERLTSFLRGAGGLAVRNAPQAMRHPCRRGRRRGPQRRGPRADHEAPGRAAVADHGRAAGLGALRRLRRRPDRIAGRGPVTQRHRERRVPGRPRRRLRPLSREARRAGRPAAGGRRGEHSARGRLPVREPRQRWRLGHPGRHRRPGEVPGDLPRRHARAPR